MEQGLVSRQLSLGLGQLHLKWTRVDLRQEIPVMDALPFLEQDLRQFSVHAGMDGHRVERRDRPSPVRYTVISPIFAAAATTGTLGRCVLDSRWAARDSSALE